MGGSLVIVLVVVALIAGAALAFAPRGSGDAESQPSPARGVAAIVLALLLLIALGALAWLFLAPGGLYGSRYEADYDMQVVTVDGGAAPDSRLEIGRATVGDGGGATVEGLGDFSTRVHRLEPSFAEIEVTHPDGSTDLVPVLTDQAVEHSHATGGYRVRITLKAVRPRE